MFIALHKYSVYFFFHFEILFLESLLFYYIYFIMDCWFFSVFVVQVIIVSNLPQNKFIKRLYF